MVDVGPVSSFTARSPVILSGDRLYIDNGAGGDFSLSLAVLQASLTKVGKVTVTQPATGSTLTIADGKTLTASNTLIFTGTDGITVAFGGGLSIAAAKVLTVSNTFTLAGTDSTVMTFPATSATIARTDAANTFTGIQTFSTPIATASVATMTATVGGGVPTPPNNTTTFLRGDGTFAATGDALTTNPLSQFAATTSAQLAGVISNETGSGLLVFGTNPTLIGATIDAGSLTISGAISAAAWTTAGIKIKGVTATLTDTSSSGTVATAYTNVFSGHTIAASSATTFTSYFNTYFVDPTAGSNVTLTNKWALGADSFKIGTVTTPSSSIFAVAYSGSANDAYSIGTSGVFGAQTNAGGIKFQLVPTAPDIRMSSDFLLRWNSTTTLGSGAIDATLARLGIANLRQGAAPSATPVAQKFTLGEASRPATDSNVAGASGTLQSGNGTGNATPSTLILQSPIAVASGTGAQTQTTGLIINQGVAVRTNYTVAGLPTASAALAGAMAWVTDASTTLVLGLGGPITGGGANKVPASCDGTNWNYG